MMGKMKEAKGTGGNMMMMKMTRSKLRSKKILLGGSWKMTGGKMKMAWVGQLMFGKRRMREVESWEKDSQRVNLEDFFRRYKREQGEQQQQQGGRDWSEWESFSCRVGRGILRVEGETVVVNKMKEKD